MVKCAYFQYEPMETKDDIAWASLRLRAREANGGSCDPSGAIVDVEEDSFPPDYKRMVTLDDDEVLEGKCLEAEVEYEETNSLWCNFGTGPFDCDSGRLFCYYAGQQDDEPN